VWPTLEYALDAEAKRLFGLQSCGHAQLTFSAPESGSGVGSGSECECESKCEFGSDSCSCSDSSSSCACECTQEHLGCACEYE